MNSLLFDFFIRFRPINAKIVVDTVDTLFILSFVFRLSNNIFIVANGYFPDYFFLNFGSYV